MKNLIFKLILKFKAIDLTLRTVLYVHSLTYRMAGVLATMKEGNGIHPKHRIMQYHQWFVDNINPEDEVLDIGCGRGALTLDIASEASFVVGMDINPENIKYAKHHNIRQNIRYFCQDASPEENGVGGSARKLRSYDVIVMSNVLEHIDDRISFLQFWGQRAKKLLIRVPILDRGWLPVYMKELGMDYRLDPSHKTEHTVNSFIEEIETAGLSVDSYSINFGEIWAVVVSNDKIVGLRGERKLPASAVENSEPLRIATIALS